MCKVSQIYREKLVREVRGIIRIENYIVIHDRKLYGKMISDIQKIKGSIE